MFVNRLITQSPIPPPPPPYPPLPRYCVFPVSNENKEWSVVSVVIKIVIFLDNDFQAVISTAYAFSLPKELTQ